MLSFRKQTGIVLLMVLILLYLMASTGFYEMFFVSKKLLLNHSKWRNQLDTFSAVESLHRLIQQPINTANPCLIPTLSSNTLIHQSPSWWAGHACRLIETSTSYYVVEKLDQDNCSLVNHNGQVAEYYRFTLWFKKIFLQSTMVIPVAQSTPCVETLHRVKPGWQMTRRLGY